MPEIPKHPLSSEITPEPLYLRRREFIKNAALFLATAGGVGGALAALSGGKQAGKAPPTPGETAPPPPAFFIERSGYSTDEPKTSYDDVTTYNNFYEFGTDKADPARNAHALKPRPWTITIDGEVAKPTELDIDTLMGWFALQERIYRMRCVEAWSMVIPWLGFPLGLLLERVEPTSRAKYVAFTTLLDPEQMPGQRRRVLDWPYVEGLRLDEAMHPLTILAVGPLRQGAPEPERRAHPPGGAVEVRLQGDQVDRADQSGLRATAYELEPRPRPTSTASTPT